MTSSPEMTENPEQTGSTCAGGSSHLDRRQLLSGTAAMVAGGASMLGLSSCAPAEPDTDEDFSGQLTEVLDADLLPVGEATGVHTGDYDLLIYRDSESSVQAFHAICPHQGCVVRVGEGAERAPDFTCPCHSSRFDSGTGDVLGGPAPRGLRRHPAEVRDGGIWVEV